MTIIIIIIIIMDPLVHPGNARPTPGLLSGPPGALILSGHSLPRCLGKDLVRYSGWALGDRPQNEDSFAWGVAFSLGTTQGHQIEDHPSGPPTVRNISRRPWYGREVGCRSGYRAGCGGRAVTARVSIRKLRIRTSEDVWLEQILSGTPRSVVDTGFPRHLAAEIPSRISGLNQSHITSYDIT